MNLNYSDWHEEKVLLIRKWILNVNSTLFEISDNRGVKSVKFNKQYI